MAASAPPAPTLSPRAAAALRGLLPLVARRRRGPLLGPRATNAAAAAAAAAARRARACGEESGATAATIEDGLLRGLLAWLVLPLIWVVAPFPVPSSAPPIERRICERWDLT